MIQKMCFGLTVIVLSIALVACSVGQGVTVPDREVPIDIETALAAQNKGAAALMLGEVTWSEAEFSSLLTELLKANSGEGNPVDEITAWFEPDGLYLQIDLVEGVLPPAFGDTVAVAGNIMVSDGMLAVELDQASAGAYSVGTATLDPIAAQINAVLAGQLGGVPLTIEMVEGAITVGLQ